jgi:3-isopropylmalate dehydrogenase
MIYNIALLEGDGVGPEILKEAVLLLEVIGKIYNHSFNFQVGLVGGIALDFTGNPIPDETIELCKKSDAILLGAVGGPKWDSEPANRRPETGLLRLRKALGLYANIRPVKVHPSIIESSPLKAETVRDVNLCIVRELTGGLYFGTPRERRDGPSGTEVVDTLLYQEYEIERIIREAFEIARTRKKRLVSVDKANVLESSRLWREIANRLALQYPDVELEHMLVDNAAMQLIKNPRQFDVIVTENMFGDILSDEASVISGSIGMLPSASLGEGPGLYEPIHGSAPDIAGQNIANPLATFLSVALMLRYSLQLEREANDIEAAIQTVLCEGNRTKDLVVRGEQTVSTEEMGRLVREALQRNILEIDLVHFYENCR